MRKKITLFMLSLIACFSRGAILASLYINRTISEFSRLIELHQIEDLRKHLVIRIQAVQSDLYTVRTASSLWSRCSREGNFFSCVPAGIRKGIA